MKREIEALMRAFAKTKQEQAAFVERFAAAMMDVEAADQRFLEIIRSFAGGQQQFVDGGQIGSDAELEAIIARLKDRSAVIAEDRREYDDGGLYGQPLPYQSAPVAQYPAASGGTYHDKQQGGPPPFYQRRGVA